MIIAYVSSTDRECYSELENEFLDIQNFSNIDEFINFYASSKSRNIVLVYRIATLNEIEELKDIKFSENIYIIVVGKNSTEYSLLAGKIGVDNYLCEDEATPDDIKKLISGSQSVIKERRGKSNISVFSGISGGIGTTTIAMNVAKNISDNNADKNVLFLDFSYTKAISNLFFEHIQPAKTIIDIAMVQDLEMSEFFANGLEKYSNNFYFISGIQKHTDREELDKPENIQRFLNFIGYVKEKFDFIIIDIGVFEDVELEIDIQEVSDNIFVITEFSIPSMSILKTSIDIIDKSGWYEKTHIVANRTDSFGSVTHSEAKSILSKGLKHSFDIHYSLPNDAVHLRECWNEAKLVNDIYPDSPFMQSIEKMVHKFFINENALLRNDLNVKENSSILQRIKQWL